MEPVLARLGVAALAGMGEMTCWWRAVLAAAVLAALPAPGGAEPGIRADYLCQGRLGATALTAFFFNDAPSAVVLLVGEGATRLPQAISASGARYSDGRDSFWIKGDRATWQQGQAPPSACGPRSR